MEYDWDAVKEADNRRKHGVSFEDAVEALDDRHALTDDDVFHSVAEDRKVTIASTGKHVVLVVITANRGDVVRLISARKATRREKELYEAEIKGTQRGER